MSQQKIDQRKERKRNIKQINSRKKGRKVLAGVIGVLICAAIVFWIGFSIYRKQHENDDPRIAVDATAIEDYYNTLE